MTGTIVNEFLSARFPNFEFSGESAFTLSFSVVLCDFSIYPPSCDIKILPNGGRDIQQIKYGRVPTEKV